MRVHPVKNSLPLKPLLAREESKEWCTSADLVEVMRGSGQGLMQQVASLTIAAQLTRTSQTVGTRFRDQLKDLITRLDQYAALPCPCTCPCLAPSSL